MKGQSFLNPVKNRFLPLPRSATEGLEHEPNIGDFDVIKQLGVGSFGTVYLVSHKKTKGQYALKVIDKNLRENLEEKANFNREVEIMYKLNHPNIVKLYGHFEDDNCCYFLMQYIPKRSLFDIITIPGQAPNLKLIASVMKDLLSAVYYLHNMKPTIIHRDIKPENILLDDNSKAYLTDFGWSNYMTGQRRRQTVCGTPLYLPPEMVTHVGHDETVDIWCIGVLLFELITGNPPFEGMTFEAVRNNIAKLRISWPKVMDPDAKDLCSRILKLNGKDRLPIEQILGHNFFKKYFPNAINELIKPEHQKNQIFVVSADDPKKWGQEIPHNINANQNNQNVLNNNNNKFKKIPVEKNKNPFPKARDTFIPRANIDLYSKTDKDDKQNNNNKKTLNNSYSNNNIDKKKYTSNSNYKRVNTSFTTTTNSSYRNSQKTSEINNSLQNNNYRATTKNEKPYTSQSSKTNYDSNDKYRKSYIHPVSLKSYNNNVINNKRKIETSNISSGVNKSYTSSGSNINISSYRKTYKLSDKNTGLYINRK